MQESIFKSSLRYFLKFLCAVLGILVAIILVIAFFASAIEDKDAEPDITYKYTPKILANADGVRKSLSSSAPVILKVNINGTIGSESLNRATIHQQLIESRERFLKNDRVKAVLLEIDSPGGAVSDADGIYRAIKAYKSKYKVPVYAYVDGLCASGGMYVACAADKIYASDSSIIGSVGVVIPSILNFSKLMEKVGVEQKTLSAGKDKDELNPFRPWKEDEGANIQELVVFYYAQFVDIVATNRPKLDRTKLINEYGARIYPAEKAAEFGYIDESGRSYNQTLQTLVKDIGIEDDFYQVVEMHSENWLLDLVKSKTAPAIISGEIKHKIDFGSSFDPKLLNQFLYLYRPE